MPYRSSKSPSAGFGADRVLDNISTYWLTATGTSSARLYWEAQPAGFSSRVDVPFAATIFPKELSRPPGCRGPSASTPTCATGTRSNAAGTSLRSRSRQCSSTRSEPRSGRCGRPDRRARSCGRSASAIDVLRRPDAPLELINRPVRQASRSAAVIDVSWVSSVGRNDPARIARERSPNSMARPNGTGVGFAATAVLSGPCHASVAAAVNLPSPGRGPQTLGTGGGLHAERVVSISLAVILGDGLHSSKGDRAPPRRAVRRSRVARRRGPRSLERVRADGSWP